MSACGVFLNIADARKVRKRHKSRKKICLRRFDPDKKHTCCPATKAYQRACNSGYRAYKYYKSMQQTTEKYIFQLIAAFVVRVV